MKEDAVKPLYIIAGLSGAGKSTALRVFEDHRFFAVDGLPPGVAPEVAAIMGDGAMAHFYGMAIGLDVRQEDFLPQFEKAYASLCGHGPKPYLIFLEAEDKTLVRRYAATRRPHPLENGKVGLEEAIRQEKELLQPLRKQADLVIDSTGLNLHDLRRRLQMHLRKKAGRKLQVNILSFGFKHGIPQDADFVFDLRFLPNPYFVEDLRPLSGQDKAVAEYVFLSPAAREYADLIYRLMFFSLQAMEEEGRYRVTVCFGCTGGRHRSVAFAEDFGEKLKNAEFPLVINHRDILQ